MGYAESMHLQNMAAEYDYRTSCIDERWWTTVQNNKALYIDYDEQEHWVPIHFIVCPGCDGHGKYVNPSIDAHGLTREDFDEDPDFEEGYWRGDYDVRCSLCEGERVIPSPDNVEDEIVKEICERIDYRQSSRAEMLAEMRYGA